MIIIGLGHRARHGKGTAAEAIVRHCDRILKPVLHMGWADALYDEVNAWLVTSEGKRFRGLGGILLNKHYCIEEGDETDNISPAGLYLGRKGKPDVILPDWVKATPSAPIEPRAPYGKHAKLLQWWGTEYRRKQDPLYWVNKGVDTIQAFGRNNPTGVVLISDTRFINELGAIKILGGVNIKVRRLNEDGTEFRDLSRDPNHISETEAENYNFDYRIDSKSAVLTEELAITTFEYIRALKAGH